MSYTKLISVIVAAVLLIAVTGISPGTYPTWRTARALSASDDSIDIASVSYEDIEADLVEVGLRSARQGAVELAFYGEGSTGDTCNWVWYCTKGKDSPLEYIAHGTAALGVLPGPEAGTYWASSVPAIHTSWRPEAYKQDGYFYDIDAGSEVADAGVAKVQADGRERHYHLVYMTNGTTTKCAAVIANLE